MMREKNVFFNISNLPAEDGALLFPLSMSKLSNSHSPTQIIKELHYFADNKITFPKVGANFIYGDFLYLYSNEKASVLKDKFTGMVCSHSNALKKLVYKNRKSFQIQHGFSYMTWSQFYLLSKDFQEFFMRLKDIYKKDKIFQKYLKQDAKDFDKKVDYNQINFFLEENLLFYLVLKGQIKLPNEYIQGREKWVLICYPGNPPRNFVYLLQKNFFKLKQVQPYEGHYNLDTKRFVDFHNVDLETYSVK